MASYFKKVYDRLDLITSPSCRQAIQHGGLLSGARAQEYCASLSGLLRCDRGWSGDPPSSSPTFVIASLLPDHKTAMAFATDHSIQVDDGDSARWARARNCLAERSASDGAKCPQAGLLLDQQLFG